MTKAVASVDSSVVVPSWFSGGSLSNQALQKRQLERVSKCTSDSVIAGHTGKVTPFYGTKQFSLLNLMTFLKL